MVVVCSVGGELKDRLLCATIMLSDDQCEMTAMSPLLPISGESCYAFTFFDELSYVTDRQLDAKSLML